jgi:hypothetical protein
MTKYAKRDQRHAGFAASLREPKSPPKFPLPKCKVCGEPAKWEVFVGSGLPGSGFYCEKHIPEEYRPKTALA